MEEKKYKLYLASGIRLWTTDFKENYAPYLNKKVDVFYPALLDEEYCVNHRLIPIWIATKDLGEINNRDAVLAYMKTYDTKDNGPAGTDSTWECGYAIGNEKPTIMIVEDMEHLDYYAAQWMVTFNIGAILTVNKEVAEAARKNDKFTHTAILYCEDKSQFENKIIEFLDGYYKSIYAREGIINYKVDQELRKIADKENVLSLIEQSLKVDDDHYFSDIEQTFDEIFSKRLDKLADKKTFKSICDLEYKRAQIVREIIENDFGSLKRFLFCYINHSIKSFVKLKSSYEMADAISYWLSIPCEEIKGRKQGKKKTRPTIFYELYDLVSHHVSKTQRYYNDDFEYKAGAIIEVYNWLNTYAIDDVFDNSDTRQGHETLYKKFESKNDAYLLGGIGHCMALLKLLDLTQSNTKTSQEVLVALNDAQLLMYLGQPVDIDLTFGNRKELMRFVKNNSLESALLLYFSRIYGICGAFYEEIGRMAVKSTNVNAQFFNLKEVEYACVHIAKLFGLVQMIRNDLGDLIFPEEMPELSKGMKDSSHNDIEEGKLTLPVLYTIFNPDTNPKDRKFLIKTLGKKHLSSQAKLETSRIIWESGSTEYCMQFIEHFSDQVSKEYVKYINETPTRLKWIIKLMDITSLINLSFRKLAIRNHWRKLEPAVLDEDILRKTEEAIDRDSFLQKYR